MNIVVIGYGRVGATLARELLAAGHSITVIDRDAERVQRAVRLQGARVVAGNAADLQVQRDANVGAADIVLAVTSNDNVNLVAAQIALEVFQVAHVIARVWTPSRADVSTQRGIVTVCPTRYTVDQLWEKVREAADEAMPHTPPLRRSGRPRQDVRPVDESKFVVICGGGRVGFHLARSLRDAGHEVSLIERDPHVAQRILARLDLPVIVGDGSMGPVLEEAGATRCRVFAAVTGRDEDNLVACQTVRTLFAGRQESPPKLIARISDPNNENLYRALGVDAPVSATSIIQAVIERELPTLHIKTLLSLSAGGASVLEVTLPEGSPVGDHQLRDVVLPRECNIVALLRNERTVVPRGDTVFKAGDVVIALVARESEEELKRLLLGEAVPDAGAEHEAQEEHPSTSPAGGQPTQK